MNLLNPGSAPFRWGAALLLTTLAAGPLPAQTNWPGFRGVYASGLAEGTAAPTAWDAAKGEHILWKSDVPGLGHSSPVIWGDRIFLTSAVNQRAPAALKVGLYGDPASSEDNDIQQWKVLCYDKRDGKLLWERVAHEGAPKQKRHPKATHANCSVATDGHNVVAFFGSEGLYCYDFEGQLRWQKDWGVIRASPMVYNDRPWPQGAELEWGFASSPVIHAGRVFLQCDALTDGFVAALDLKDGREVWRTSRDDTATWSTPSVCLAGGRPQLVVNGWKHIGGYDLETGRELWRMAGGGDCPTPTPVVGHGLIFIMSAHGPRGPVYAVRPEAAGDVSLRDGASTNQFVAWSTLRGASYMQTPLPYGEFLFSCHDGLLSCFEAATGALRYRERLGAGAEGFSASPVASGGNLYFTSEQGKVFVVKAEPTFSVLRTNLMGEVCMATPAISEGTLFFRTQAHLVAVADRK